MPDEAQQAADLPLGAVDASGEPMPVAGVTPPEQAATTEEDERDGASTGELSIQGGE